MVIGNKTVERSLAFDQESPIVAGSDTDSEDFISDGDSFASESSSEEETYGVAILRDDLFDSEMNRDGAIDGDINGVSELPVLRGDPYNEEYDEVDPPQSNANNKVLKSLRETLAHLDSDS